MRVATFNLLSGRSLADGRADPAALADAVRQLDADVLALQEVDRHQARSGGADQVAVAAAAMGAATARFVPLVRGTPAEPGWRPAPPDPAEGEPAYGIALLSRRPVRSWRGVRGGRGPGPGPGPLPPPPPP